MRTLMLSLCCLTFCMAAVEVGDQAPAISSTRSLNTDDGGPIALSSYRGKVVMVDFWATWCGPCVATLPHVQKLHETYKDQGLVVIGQTDTSSRGLEAMVKDKGLTYPISVGTEIGGSWGVTGIPHVYVMGGDGKVIWHGHPGNLKDTVITEALAKLSPFDRMGLRVDFGDGSSDADVRIIERAINQGAIGKGWDKLESYVEKAERTPERAAAASASIERITAWKAVVDEEIAKLESEGDIYTAYTICAQLSTVLNGHDSRDHYKDAAKRLKKLDAYDIGRTYAGLAAVPTEQRLHPKFRAAVEKFVSKYPDSPYSPKASALLPE